MGNEKDSERLLGRIKRNMWGCGKMDSSMVKVNLRIHRGLQCKENGRMESGLRRCNMTILGHPLEKCSYSYFASFISPHIILTHPTQINERYIISFFSFVFFSSGVYILKLIAM